MKFIKDNYLIILIFLLGLVLRIYDLDNESLWYDEAFSVSISNLGPLKIIETVFNLGIEGNPPLYYLILHYWMMAFGDSEFSLRFMSVLFGLASILAVYALGKLLFNKNTGIIAALILAVSLFDVKYSQEARGYTLLTFLTITSFYSLVKLTSKKSLIHSVIYLISSTLILYTHFYAIFIIAAQNIFCLTLFVMHRKAGEITFRKWILLQVVIFIAFIPGLIKLLYLKATVEQSFWISKPTINIITKYLDRYTGLTYLLIIFAVFALISIISFTKLNISKGLRSKFWSLENYNPELGISIGSRIYLLMLWFLFPIAIPVIYSIVSTPMFTVRYAIIAVASSYILVSYGISGFKSKWAVFAAGLIILALSMPTLQGYYSRIGKPDWRGVMAEIEKNAAYGELLVIQPAMGYLPIKYYQTRDDIIILPLKEEFPSFDNLGESSVWVIMSANPKYKNYITEGLGDRYDIELEKQFVYLDLFRLRYK